LRPDDGMRRPEPAAGRGRRRRWPFTNNVRGAVKTLVVHGSFPARGVPVRISAEKLRLFSLSLPVPRCRCRARRPPVLRAGLVRAGPATLRQKLQDLGNEDVRAPDWRAAGRLIAVCRAGVAGESRERVAGRSRRTRAMGPERRRVRGPRWVGLGPGGHALEPRPNPSPWTIRSIYLFASTLRSTRWTRTGFGVGVQEANSILAPPVFLYWWAAAVRLFGGAVYLKLWALPFTAVRGRVVRLGGGSARGWRAVSSVRPPSPRLLAVGEPDMLGRPGSGAEPVGGGPVPAA